MNGVWFGYLSGSLIFSLIATHIKLCCVDVPDNMLSIGLSHSLLSDIVDLFCSIKQVTP